MPRNPKWTNDEHILALNLYFDSDGRMLDPSDEKVIELSNLLNSLPIHSQDIRSENFRNPDGVSMEGFAECHHTIPVSKLKKRQKTKLSDLSILCANCHRMIHRSKPMLSIEQLQELLQNV